MLSASGKHGIFERGGLSPALWLGPARSILWLSAQVPESVLDRDQYICNQAHLINAFDVAHKFNQVAFDCHQAQSDCSADASVDLRGIVLNRRTHA
jgi:hypothetical protein